MWGEVVRASGFSALTTIIGLLALLSSEVTQLREFGILGAVGMGCDLAVKWHEFNRKVVNDDQAVETSTPAWYASVITLT